jgi:hypothetical protein
MLFCAINRIGDNYFIYTLNIYICEQSFSEIRGLICLVRYSRILISVEKVRHANLVESQFCPSSLM